MAEIVPGPGRADQRPTLKCVAPGEAAVLRSILDALGGNLRFATTPEPGEATAAVLDAAEAKREKHRGDIARERRKRGL